MSDYMNKDESSSANMPQIFAKGQFGVSDVGSDSLPEVLMGQMSCLQKLKNYILWIWSWCGDRKV